MMNFIMLTISMTVGVVLGGIVSTAIYIALISNTKFIAWFMKRYVNMVEKITEELEDVI